MYIKILVYIIDNQQFKLKISIPFWLAGRLPFLFSALRGLGGRSKKRQTPRPDFGEVVRPSYPSYPSYPHQIHPSSPHVLFGFSMYCL